MTFCSVPLDRSFLRTWVSNCYEKYLECIGQSLSLKSVIFCPPLDRGNEFKVLHGHPIDFVSLLKKQVVVQFPLFERYGFSLEKMTIHPFKIFFNSPFGISDVFTQKTCFIAPKVKGFSPRFRPFFTRFDPKM